MESSLPQAIEKAGVVGFGGGGFPTHVKARSSCEFVIANGAECEPLLGCDSAVMSHHPDRVLKGLRLMRDAVGATRAVVAVKRKNARALEALSAAVGSETDIELAALDNVFPAGDEFLLVYEMTGRVTPEGGIPLDVGVLVNNVCTLASVADAALGRPVTDRLITVHGEVESPGTFLVPVGTPVHDVVELAGGLTTDDVTVILGGPMMGKIAQDLSEPLTKRIGGVIVLPTQHPLVQQRLASTAWVLKIARAACCQCLACTELCPRALLGHDLAPHRTVRAIQYSMEASDQEHITSAFLCCECGMCELFACPLGIQPRRILAELKVELAARGIENPHLRKDLSPDTVREYRKIPTSRLVQRLGLSAYDTPADFSPDEVHPDRVVLKMKQHVGAPAAPVVDRGQEVLKGDVVGEIPQGLLGARVHASISGVIEEASRDQVTIAAA